MARLDEVLREHQGPPVNVEGVIRALGIELDKKADLAPEIAGQIECLGNGKYKISVNRNDHYFRRRFTMAHELGHYLFHAHLISEGVDDNRAYRRTPDGQYYNRQITQAEETQANRLAASVLMPKDLVAEYGPKLNYDIAAIAKQFQVSPKAMEIRLDGLGLTR